MMTPITRKEKYINQIVGGGDTAPKTPQTREEFFFAEILGEVIAPSPVTRVEKYLSAIARQYSGDLPTPITRIEYFLARAAGMDVTIPTPITREEMLWANYALIVEKELSGIPPLTYKAIEGTLENYRIYGNTVNGESVGNIVTDSQSEHYGKYAIPVTTNSETANIFLDEPLRMVGDEAEYIDFNQQKLYRVRKNLFYITKFTNNNTQLTAQGVNFSIIDNEVYANGTTTGMYPQAIGFDYVLTEGETYAATLYIEGEYTGLPYIYCTTTYDSVGNYQKVPPNVRTIFTALPDTRILFVAQGTGESFNIKYKLLITKATIEDDTYEPYIENTDLDVTLPALPVLPGTNTLTVETEVQPSNVYIKYEGAR